MAEKRCPITLKKLVFFSLVRNLKAPKRGPTIPPSILSKWFEEILSNSNKLLVPYFISQVTPSAGKLPQIHPRRSTGKQVPVVYLGSISFAQRSLPTSIKRTKKPQKDHLLSFMALSLAFQIAELLGTG